MIPARVVIFLACLVGLTAPAAADDALATFFAQLFGQTAPPQPGIIKPLRRALRERAQGTRLAGESGVLLTASFYGHGERLSSHMANGERFNPYAMVAAHRSWPFGTRVQVCHLGCVVVRIADRGPFVRGRSLDLSWGAARAIGLRQTGIVRVAVL